MNLKDWLIRNLKENWGRGSKETWSILFGVACWHIWLQRNHCVFSGESEIASSLFHRVMGNVHDIVGSQNSLPDTLHRKTLKQEVLVRWNFPDHGWWKLNVDCSHWTSDNSIDCDDVLRDATGSWLMGFSKKLGKGNSVLAEVWAIYQGLSLAWQFGIEKVIVEANSAIAINLVKEGCVEVHPSSSLVGKIREMTLRRWHLHFQHTCREGNKVADCLANLAHSLPFGDHVFQSPPP